MPGGHNVIWDGKAEKPFIPPTKEFDSIALRHSDVVIDIGAYCGTYALRCARFPVRQVVAYEPTPATFEILSATRLPNLELVNAAVVPPGAPETVDLFVSHGIGVTNGLVAQNRKAYSIKVHAVSFEAAVSGASVVKIDVEGAEYTYPLLCSDTVRALIIDFHPLTGRNWVRRANEMIAEIEAAGFTPVVSPDWSNGWTRAGSWIRERETSGEFEPMMRGQLCCGCATPVHGEGRSLCASCWALWTPRHREGYGRA